jgi:hypothetical protein
MDDCQFGYITKLTQKILIKNIGDDAFHHKV